MPLSPARPPPGAFTEFLMKIVVCIKQVPGTSEVEVDEQTGVLKRDGVDSKLNPYDLYALETALRIKQGNGARITAISMGPPQAEQVLREAYMMGVDEAVLLTDRKFAGAETAVSTPSTFAHTAVTNRAEKSRHHPNVGGRTVPT